MILYFKNNLNSKIDNIDKQCDIQLNCKSHKILNFSKIQLWICHILEFSFSSYVYCNTKHSIQIILNKGFNLKKYSNNNNSKIPVDCLVLM